jgi:PTH1 family peptidyl-tRNA hydrolase
MSPTPGESTHIIVGLGNPGNQYAKTRHNAGFMVINEVALYCGIPLNHSKFDNRFGRGTIQGIDVILVKPMAFMNKSGPPVQQLLHFFKIPAKNLLVIHDDIDLMYGRVKLIAKGGDAGHQGVRSLIATLGDNDFPRLRIGVGRPDKNNDVINHVLSTFTKEEEQILGKIITKARECIVLLLEKGIKECMNQVNNRKWFIEQENKMEKEEKNGSI